MNQKPSISYPMQFAILVGLWGMFIIVTALVVGFAASLSLHLPMQEALKAMNRPENASLAKLLNSVASVLTFICPALVFARIVNPQPFSHLGFNKLLSAKQFLMVLLLTFASMVLGGALSELNERIPLPGNLYAGARELEEKYKEATLAMANMQSVPEYLLALIVLAAIPAFCEEVMFRGALQPVFTGWTKSKWAGIILTAVIFSAIHFSFFGFLARAALGIVLGLIFYNSRNIWLSIFLHFLNNAFVVTQLYIGNRQGKPLEKTMDESMPIWWGAIALVIVIVFFRAFNRETAKVLSTEAVTATV
ncbi:MAG: CPBP family intramembrane metalloprotease [Chitinophagaceae bacterium]|nr:CPBP family intramembrane metalloprotease [Chitinophagaceae bacterium]